MTRVESRLHILRRPNIGQVARVNHVSPHVSAGVAPKMQSAGICAQPQRVDWLICSRRGANRNGKRFQPHGREDGRGFEPVRLNDADIG